MRDDRPVVVIGSGFGGLAAAVRMRAQGYRVLLLEARDQLGGRAAVFERDGHVFDAGPTVITAPYLLEELFALAGRDMRDFMELVPVDPFYRIEFADGSRFDYVGEEERLLANIRELSPPDVDNYRRMVKHMEAIFDVGYTKLVDVPFERFTDMMKVVPDMLRLGNHRSVYGMVSRYMQDERLRQVFTFQPLLIGGNPFRATSIYTLIHWLERKWGVHFAKGGTTNLNEVYQYAEQVEAGKGLVFMDAPAFDPVGATAQVAGGAQVMVFTTDRGSAFGCKPAPSIKLAGSTSLFQRMPDDMDINTGTILDGTETVEEVGRRIFERIVEVASGQCTRSEMMGYGEEEFCPWDMGVIL